MAAADYYLCDICSCKTFYDADVDYDRVGDIHVICPDCDKEYEVIITIKARGEEE